MSVLATLALVASVVSCAAPRPTDSQLQTVWYNKTSGTYLPPPNVTLTADQMAEVVPASRIYADNAAMMTTGWATVYIEADSMFMHNYSVSQGYYAVGFAEGLMTYEQMYDNYYNLYPPTDNLTQQADVKVEAWIKDQFNYMTTSAEANKATSEYWMTVYNVLQQFQGMVDGYQLRVPMGDEKYLDWYQIYMIGFNFELYDVQAATTVWNGPGFQNGFLPHVNRRSRCSALIKVTSDDLFMGHDTWSGYNTMLRQYKIYNFTRLNDEARSRVVAMSSYPATLHSGDDWYMLSNGLTVQETTNDNYNKDSYQYIVTNTVAEMIRVMVSNYMATTGDDWTETFCRQNSGTYNNQYMVVNMNLFNATETDMTKKVPNGTLWIMEQMPNMCKREDVSMVLRETSYWASYNLPSIPAVQAWSGTLAKEAEFGTFFSYTNYSRAEIFRAHEGGVTDLDSMQAMLRYNQYKTDPFSLIPNCSGTPNNTCTPPYAASLTIASRFDLNTNGTNKTLGPLFMFVDKGAFGAIDTKIVAWSEHKDMIGHLISGPTVQPDSDIAPFQWAGTEWETGYPRRGIPESFNFQFMSSTQLVEGTPASKKVPQNKFWILGVVAGIIVVCVVAAVIYKKKSEGDGDGTYQPLDSNANKV